MNCLTFEIMYLHIINMHMHMVHLSDNLKRVDLPLIKDYYF